MSESSAERLGMKPDFTVMTMNPQKHVELFIIEIKPNKTNNALVLEDLVSLGKTMKCAIDNIMKFLGRSDHVIPYGLVQKYVEFHTFPYILRGSTYNLWIYAESTMCFVTGYLENIGAIQIST